MEVQEKYLRQIPVDSVAGISAANLLGDKFLNITKGRDARRPSRTAPKSRACRRRTFPS